MSTKKQELFALANSWVEEAGSVLEFWPIGKPYGVALLMMPPEKAALVACAIALRDALASDEELCTEPLSLLSRGNANKD